MTLIGAELRSCEKCGNRFTPRSGSGGSVQRFCGTDCRLSFHRERLRSQRTGLYAGQSQQQPTTLLEQAEGLIASLPLDQRRRLIRTTLTIPAVRLIVAKPLCDAATRKRKVSNRGALRLSRSENCAK